MRPYVLARAADAFLHPSLRGEWDVAQRARRLVLLTFLMCALVCREAFEGYRSGAMLRVYAAIGCVPLAAVVLVSLRRGALVFATHAFVGTLVALAVLVTLLTGAPAPLLALSTLAFVALLILGREGGVWVGVTVLLTFAVVGVRALGLMARPFVYTPLAQALDAGVVCVTTSTFAWMFVMGRQRLLDALARINVELKADVLERAPAAPATKASSAPAAELSADDHRALEERLMVLNAELAVLSRQHSRQARALEQANTQLKTEILEHTRAEERATAANVAKSQFLANMSHEIRTPMTAIMGFGDLLLDEQLTRAERSGYVETIRRNGAHLLGIINNILDLSKVESGKIDAESIAFCPQSLLAEVVSSLRVSALHKGLELRVVCATPVPATIQSDPTRLRQILTNLVANAIKFTSAGGVTITLRRGKADAGGSARLAFEVTDTGAGIPPDAVVSLFQPFAQGDASMTRKFGGTGLGLAISERLARALGGELVLARTGSAGSSFVLRLPTGPLSELLPAHESASERGPQRPSEAGLSVRADARVLLAEDGPDNQALIGLYLRREGVRSVTVAENGLEAVRLALAARADGQPFALVLMDMQMPEKDGYTATRELRAAGYGGPIVALTAHAMNEDEARCRAAGCDGFLTKPVVLSAFTAVLQQYLRGAGAEGVTERAVPEGPSRAA